MADKVNTEATGGWSKYLGGWYGYANHTKIREEWACQACGERQPESIRPFMFKIFHREYVRICPLCLHISKAKKITVYTKLVRIVRKST